MASFSLPSKNLKLALVLTQLLHLMLHAASEFGKGNSLSPAFSLLKQQNLGLGLDLCRLFVKLNDSKL